MEKKRPLLVTVFAGFYAMFYVTAGFLWWKFLNSDILSLSYSIPLTKFVIQKFLVNFFLIFSIILAICNFGIIFYKQKARKIYLVIIWVFIILFLYTVLLLIAEHFICTDDCRPTISSNGLLAIVALFLGVSISSVVFFTRPKVKEQFR